MNQPRHTRINAASRLARSTLAAALLLAPLAPAQPSPQPEARADRAAGTPSIRLLPTLAHGRELTYEIERTLRVEQRPHADPRPLITVASLSAVVRLRVGTVRADGTTEATIEFVSLALERDHAGETLSFRYPAEPAPDQPRRADEKPRSAYEILGAAWTTNRPRVVINREGAFQSMLGVEPILDAYKTAQSADHTLDAAELATLSPAAIGDLLTPIFNPAQPERPSRAFTPGETWSAQRTVDLADLGALVTTESWSMSPESDASSAIASATIRAEVAPPRGIVTAAPALKLESSAGAASIQWDGAAASLRRFEHKVMLGFTATLGDLTLEQTQVASTLITRRE